MPSIYLDYNATTPVCPEALEAMLPFLREDFGNPSSDHAYGRRARQAVEEARAQVAALLGCRPGEVIFTSGGSESNNTALKGVVAACGRSRPHVVVSAVEHPAVLGPCRWLERQGVRVTRVPVDGQGRVDPARVEAALEPDTVLVSIMHANNETGTLQPLAEISSRVHRQGVLLHTDAAQSAGKIPVRVEELGVDLLSLAGHKMYAPKGVGALYVRSGVRLEPLVHGSGHEGGRRAGTESVPLVVALGVACRRAAAHLEEYRVRIGRLRDHLEHLLRRELGERLVLNGHPQERLPSTLNVSFLGLSGHELLERVPRVAASTGSACHSGSSEGSPVLAAMGADPRVIQGAVRFSLGLPTTREEVEEAARLLVEAARGALTC